VLNPETGEVISAGALAKRKSMANPNNREKARLANRKAARKYLVTPERREKRREARLKRKTAEAAYNKTYWANRRANEPLFKLRQNLVSLIRSSMKAKGWSKSTKTQALVGCSFDFLMNHLKQSLPTYVDHDVVHIDHILCCASAENEDELNAFQHWSNLQWLPGPENISKGDALPPDWKERKAQLMAIYWERFPERREAA